ncbi:hypothetical protein Ahy_A10g048624 [Arachis hypogaea]|uniref:DUF4283 domain-containing protein n=1 Tax=Arachis hypogaea TaxID=3818 RepID=A0A445B5H7_ARAHY|nr:hypothetical protein Ahy_A10g048624 [Arachis hypogaea]
MSNTNTILDTQNTTQDQEDEELLVVFNNKDVREGIQGCENSLIGRLLTEKSINSAWIQSAIQNIWKKPKGLRIVELKPRFTIFFQKETDLDRVLKGSPWYFRNLWFLLKKWDRSEDPIEKGLGNVDIKVQIWNLLEHYKTARLGWRIAYALGIVKECDGKSTKWRLGGKERKNTISQQRLTTRMLEKLEKLTMIDIPKSNNSKRKEAEQLQYNLEQIARIE